MKMDIKILSVICFTMINSSLVFSMDPSTPDNGNLFIDIPDSFRPAAVRIFDNDLILSDMNILRADNRLFRGKKKDVEFFIEDRTSGTDISWIDSETFVVLTGNSDRYNHGILGDSIEATGFKVYKGRNLYAEFELSGDLVFETLRPLIADIVPENPGAEIILTSSNKSRGSRIDIFSQNGKFIGNSEPIGRGFRWLHIIAVAPVSGDQKPYLAIVRTPHINGILELYTWTGRQLVKEASFANVSTHQIGSDNLNMALAVNMDSAPGVEFLLPSSDFRSIAVIKYENGMLNEVKRFGLPDRISTNFLFDSTGSYSVWVGLSNGKVIKLSE